MSVQKAQQVAWSLTRRRLGTRFLGLDAAGNVLFYPNFHTTTAATQSSTNGNTNSRGSSSLFSFGAWDTVTFAFDTKQADATFYMEQGHPMHQKAVTRLETLIRERKREFDSRQERARAKIKERELKQNSSSSSGATDPDSNNNNTTTGEGVTEPILLEDESVFLANLAKELTAPSFLRRHLRVHSLIGFRGLYHLLILSFVGVVFLLIREVYCAFKGWVRMTTREAFENIEEKWCYYPRQALWLVREYAGVDLTSWEKLTAQWSTVSQQVGETCEIVLKDIPVIGKEARARAQEAEDKLAAEALRLQKLEEDRKQWWERLAASLLMMIIVLCLA